EGEFDEAILEYRNVLQIDPNDVEAHRELASAYLKSNKVREGYWELSETIRLDPKDVDTRIQFAALTIAGGRFDEVIEAADEILELDPDNSTGHLFRGQALIALERPVEAQASIERAVELEPDQAAPRLALASLYQQTGELEEAETQLEESLVRDPSTLGHTMLAALLNARKAGDPEIEEQLSSALKLASEPNENGSQQRELLSAYKNLSSFYVDRDRSDEAIALLESGIDKVGEGKLDLSEYLVRYLRSIGEDEHANLVLERTTTFDVTDSNPWLVISNNKGKSGDLEGALEAAEKAIEADPEDSRPRLRKAELLIDRGVAEEDLESKAQGRELAEAELRANPSSPEASFVMGKVELADGNHDAAIGHLRRTVEGQPGWPQAHFVLGSVFLLNGESQRARASLARAVELSPNFDEARRILIRLHARLGEHEYAIENGRRYMSRKPDDYATRILVGQSMVRLGMVEEAREVLDQIPEEGRGVEAQFAMGRLAMLEGDAELAYSALLKADELSPNDPRVLGSLLVVDSADGDLSRSVARIQTALEVHPESAPLWRVNGMAQMRLGQIKKAEEAFKKSLDLNPNEVENYAQLARIYAASGRLDLAIQQYESASKARPDNPTVHHFLGVLYEMTGDKEKARTNYENALQQDDNLAETKNNLAYMMAQEEGSDLDRALKLSQEAKAAMPDSSSAADTLGWVLYKRGVSSAAIGYLREALSIAQPDDPGVPEIRLHLSIAYESTGDLDKALETLETGLSNLQALKDSGKVSKDPSWAGGMRERVQRLKTSG
ncbi:MAG: tetratricopeptide repeat protein, partial [Myxococcota bacterium]